MSRVQVIGLCSQEKKWPADMLAQNRCKLLCTVLGAFPREAQVESGMVSEQTITYLDVVCWVVILVSATLSNDFVCVSMCVDALCLVLCTCCWSLCHSKNGLYLARYIMRVFWSTGCWK